MTQINYMDMDEFVKGGFLQEANRLFFHPLGLALEVACDVDGKATHFSGVWDYRSDPEGIIFGGAHLPDEEKAQAVGELARIKALQRLSVYGWDVQPTGQAGYVQTYE